MTSELKYPCTHEEGLEHRRNVARSQLSEEAKVWLETQDQSLTALQLLFRADTSELCATDVLNVFRVSNASPPICFAWFKEGVKCSRRSGHTGDHAASLCRTPEIHETPMIRWTDT